MSSARSRSGGRHHAHDIQAMVKVAAERASAHHFGQVAIGAGQETRIHLHRDRFAHRHDFLLLQDAQQLGLKLSGKSQISSRKTVPQSAVRITPSMFCSAPVKAPRTWPKNWLSNSVSLMPEQLTGIKGRSRR